MLVRAHCQQCGAAFISASVQAQRRAGVPDSNKHLLEVQDTNQVLVEAQQLLVCLQLKSMPKTVATAKTV